MRALTKEAQLVDQCGGKVYEFALAISGNHLDAEEILQQSFAEAFSAGELVQEREPPCNSLIRTAAREALRRLNERKSKSFNSLPHPAVAVEELASAQIVPWHDNPQRLYPKTQLRRITNEALESLHPALRLVVILRDVRNFPWRKLPSC